VVGEVLEIPPDAQLEPAGSVEGVVEDFLVVAADSQHRTLDIDSILCFHDRTPLGKVFEVFGPVKKPYYSVLNASAQRVRELGKDSLLARGTPVYFVPQVSSFVLPQAIYTKGSDASNENDEEPPDDELEFSDDEQEAQHRRQKKKKLQELKRARSQGWEDNAEMCLVSSSSAGTARGRGRGRGDRGRGRAANWGGFAGGGWSQPPQGSNNNFTYPSAPEYTPLARPSYLVEHVMNNSSYGGTSAHSFPVPYMQQALPMPLPMPHVPAAAASTATSVSTATQTHSLPLPYPQMQASWQNQFYASPHSFHQPQQPHQPQQRHN